MGQSSSLAKQSRDQKVCSVIQSNILRNSIDNDMHHECIGQMGSMKYLRESYQHRIEYSVANSLAAIMRKLYLNSIFQPYSYSQKLQEGADGIKINTSNLRYTWRVEMKDKREYKIKRSPKWKGIKELREKYCNNKNCVCNQL